MDKKIALITGAGSGIGKASAKALSKSGFVVVLTGRRQEALQNVESEIKKDGGEATAIVSDVTDESSVENLFLKINQKFGCLHLLFNNAGTGLPPTTPDQISLSQWKSCVDTILLGSFLCTRGAFKIMRDQTPRGGRIINNGSVSSHVPRPGSIAYTTAKHGITGLTKATSLDGRHLDIVCGQIDIGNAVTDLTKSLGAGMVQASGKVEPEATFDVDHVARAVVYMAELPLNANVQFMTLMASKMPFIGRG